MERVQTSLERVQTSWCSFDDPSSTISNQISTVNPFVRRQNYNKSSVITYRALTIVTWVLVILLCLAYTIYDPVGAKTIQDQNASHPSPFALHPYVTGVFWGLLLISQAFYVYVLFGPIEELVIPAANIGSHFVAFNLLTSAYILLMVHGQLVWGEIVLILNWFNVTALYFRHLRLPFFIHIPVVAGPLAWSYVVLFSNGAAMINSAGTAANILANVAVWSWMLYGLFFLAAFQDYGMGLATSFLTAALATQQMAINIDILQLIFSFTILGVLLFCTCIVVILRIFGKELSIIRYDDEAVTVGERRFLLDDD